MQCIHMKDSLWRFVMLSSARWHCGGQERVPRTNELWHLHMQQQIQVCMMHVSDGAPRYVSCMHMRHQAAATPYAAAEHEKHQALACIAALQCTDQQMIGMCLQAWCAPVLPPMPQWKSAEARSLSNPMCCISKEVSSACTAGSADISNCSLFVRHTRLRQLPMTCMCTADAPAKCPLLKRSN